MANFGTYEWFLPSSVVDVPNKKKPKTKKAGKQQRRASTLVELCSQVVARTFKSDFRCRLPMELLEMVQKRMSREDQIEHLNEYKKWNKDGRLEAIQSFDKRGRPHGDYLVWHRNGERKMHVIYEHGRRHGLCQWWQKDGKLETSEQYDNGLLSIQTLAAAN